MSTAAAFFAILSSAVTVIGGQAGLLWWAYKRGEEAGERKAGQAEERTKLETLEQQLAATQAKLTSVLPAHKHALQSATLPRPAAQLRATPRHS